MISLSFLLKQIHNLHNSDITGLISNIVYIYILSCMKIGREQGFFDNWWTEGQWYLLTLTSY